MKEASPVLFEIVDRVAYITLNRPDKRNALNLAMMTELTSYLKSADENPAIKVVVIRANGKAFCAGADLAYLKQLQKNSLEDNLKDSNQLLSAFQGIYKCSKPVIAQIEGHAIAGGCGIATICDFAFTIPEAKFGYTEVKIGFIPAIVMLFALRKAGELRGKELLLSGKIIDAATAVNYNLINEVVPSDKIKDHVKAFADMLCNQNSGQSMALTKEMISVVQTMPMDEALEYAAKKNAEARATEDCKKGIAAFLNKEKLEW